jgi:hypothetical protein
MRTVWKFPINCNSIKDSQYQIFVQMPRGAEVLCVMNQPMSGVCIWAEVDPELPHSRRVFLCVGTGHGSVPKAAKYIGSVVEHECVWHLYEPICRAGGAVI